MKAVLWASDPNEAAVLKLILQQAGFISKSCRKLEMMQDTWQDQGADLLFFAPIEETDEVFEYLLNLRASSAITIAVLTDPISESRQIQFLDEGTDLLCSRPYSPRLLEARIKALARRTCGVPFFSLPTINLSSVSLDPASREVSVGDHSPVRLTQLEFRLLYMLMSRYNQIVPTESIVEHVWGYSGEGNRELVRGLVKRLRNKIEDQPKDPEYIRTVAGVGYFFNAPEE
ncbi:MAG: response regulator transcription factor [Anaerolineaceae bacterium]|nr:response regulator transcription factor [Anaerolineaceae bacterium]